MIRSRRWFPSDKRIWTLARWLSGDNVFFALKIYFDNQHIFFNLFINRYRARKKISITNWAGSINLYILYLYFLCYFEFFRFYLFFFEWDLNIFLAFLSAVIDFIVYFWVILSRPLFEFLIFSYLCSFITFWTFISLK